MNGENFFLWTDTAPEQLDGFAYEPVRLLRQLKSKEICYAVMTGWHLYNWYRSNRICGCCGTPTEHDTKERMLRCPSCGNLIFPRISPAVIVAVTDGDRLLLSKYAGRAYTRYALLAGYTEIGETIEQTVHREVLEEVGLKVKNLRYYKSQPWGVDGNVLMGFYCDLDGSDAIRIDEEELAMAGWYPRHDLPAQDDGISLTREMIRIFGEGKEPK
jgi:NAD+ diphosphatase